MNRKQNKTKENKKKPTTTRTLNKTNNFVHRNEFIIYDEMHIESNPKSERKNKPKKEKQNKMQKKT